MKSDSVCKTLLQLLKQGVLHGERIKHLSQQTQSYCIHLCVKNKWKDI